MGQLVFVVAAVMTLMNTKIGSAAVGHSDCILIMGGRPNDTIDKLPIEYYHPAVGVECNDNHIIPNFKLTKYQSPMDTSGCYLTKPQMIVIREGRRHPNKSTIFYLGNGTTARISAVHSAGVVVDSASVSMGPSRCLSCGGFNQKSTPDNNINECYVFEAATNEWSAHSNVTTALSAAAFVSLGGQFYIVGGRTNIKKCATNLYVSNNSQWEQKAAMINARVGHSAAPLSDDELIVCGNDCTSCNPASCEIYNTTNDTWREAGNMTTGRRYFSLLTFNDQIYAIGGLAGNNRTPTDSVEVYNRTNDSWSLVVKPLKFARNSFVAFAITLPPKPLTTTAPPQTPISPPQTPHKGTTTHATADDFDVRIIWIIVLTVVGTILTILAFLILCISWKKGYFSKGPPSSKSNRGDDEQGAKVRKKVHPWKKSKRGTKSVTTNSERSTVGDDMQPTTDEEMTMNTTKGDDGITWETDTEPLSTY